jgi:hypothetical protein
VPDDTTRLDPESVPNPLDYPFEPAQTSGVLLQDQVVTLVLGAGSRAGDGVVRLDDGTTPTLDELLGARGLAPCADRTLVVAVGSNAAPAVLLRKFHRQGASTVVPLVMVTAAGIGLGYSAHVSKQGFVAATPFAQPGSSRTLVGSLLDVGQLDALDRTEPNYRRLLLGADDYPLTVHGSGDRPPVWSVYESIHGVLCIDGDPVRLGTQADLHAWLTAVPAIDAIAGLGADSDEALARLQQEPIREALKAHWREHGHAAGSGLVGTPR